MLPKPLATVDTSSLAGMPSRMPVNRAVISIMTPESIFSLMMPYRRTNRLTKKMAMIMVLLIFLPFLSFYCMVSRRNWASRS